MFKQLQAKIYAQLSEVESQVFRTYLAFKIAQIWSNSAGTYKGSRRWYSFKVAFNKSEIVIRSFDQKIVINKDHLV
jgi:hypothetical protein